MNYVKGIKIGGATAAQIPCIPGRGAPTTETEGAVGCLYMDEDTGAMYKCTAVNVGVYTWVLMGEGDGVAVSHFGTPYSSATQTVDISAAGDGSVKLYLFSNGNGKYDGVVRGSGAIRDYTEDNRLYPVEQISRLHIENGITSIGAYFMYGAYALQDLSFADSTAITHLGAYAFAKTMISGEYDFSGLTDTEMQCVFMGCARLEGLTLSSIITTIKDDQAFRDCFALQYVKGLTGLTEITGRATFYNCTSLAELDVNPVNVTLDEQTFVHVPSSAVISGTTMPLYKANWGNIGTDCFVQNMWTDDQLTAIGAAKGETTNILPMPVYDAQTEEFYDSYNILWAVGTKSGNLECKQRDIMHSACGYFSLFHIYNVMHPDSQYPSFREFVEKLILPRKITVTQEMHDFLANDTYGQMLIAENTDGFYDVGQKITAFDLLYTLSDEDFTANYTVYWGILQALGWTATKTPASSFKEEEQEDGTVVLKSEMKQVLIDTLMNNQASLITLFSAGQFPAGGHATAVIGYDAATDKFLIVDSNNNFVPREYSSTVYWVDLEAFTAPASHNNVQLTYILTFDFGEVVTMTDIDKKLDILLGSVNSGFYTESDVIPLDEDLLPTSGSQVTFKIPCSNGAKIIEFHPDSETAAAIKASTTELYLYGFIGNCFAPEVTDYTGKARGFASYMDDLWSLGTNHGRMLCPAGITVDNTDGITVKTYAVKAGKYHWTAYYWND